MNEAQMRSLVAAVRTGSINAAARELFVTPPSMHQRLAALEAEVGCDLLVRTRRGVAPTEAGRILAGAFGECLSALDRALAEVAALGGAGRPRVRVGTQWRPSVGEYYAVEEFRSLHPDADVSVEKVCGEGLAEALLKGDIDVFLAPRSVAAEGEAGLAFHPFGTEACRCVCGPESRWAAAGRADAASLSGATVYAGSDYRGYSSYAGDPRVEALCALPGYRSGMHPTEEIVSACLSGAGVVLFSEGRADDLCPPLAHVPMDLPELEGGAYTRSDPGEGVLEFVALLRGHRRP